jgi:hypothetical protein
MAGRAAAHAILEGFGQEFEQVGGGWQCPHAANAPLLNVIGF